jgi:hypothetical protein
MTAAQKMLGTFDVRASAPATSPAIKPDELMLDFTALPKGSTASIYLPATSADAIITKAFGLHGSKKFTRVDAHTLRCDARGMVYMPIPAARGNLGGLIDIVLPGNLPQGRKYVVVVNQITHAQGPLLGSLATANRTLALPVDGRLVQWRKLAGLFQLQTTIRPQSENLPIAERNLSILRWIFESIPGDSRWWPIFERYLGALAAQINAMGGDADTIPPSSGGVRRGGPGSKGQTRPGGDGARGTEPYGPTGKIDGLVYDHFGDFEGFILVTEEGERHHFFSREQHMEEVVERAWAERLRVTVLPGSKIPRHPRRVTLHPTPHAH